MSEVDPEAEATVETNMSVIEIRERANLDVLQLCRRQNRIPKRLGMLSGPLRAKLS